MNDFSIGNALYIDDNGKVSGALEQAVTEKTVELPPELEPVKEQTARRDNKSL